MWYEDYICYSGSNGGQNVMKHNVTWCAKCENKSGTSWNVNSCFYLFNVNKLTKYY